MKALPKLSKAQAEAWKRVLEWYARENRMEDFHPGSKKYDSIGNGFVSGASQTFDALVAKGMLIVHRHLFHKNSNRYTIHPDYLPTSEPAAPEREPELTANAEYWNALTRDQQYDLWKFNEGRGVWANRLGGRLFDRMTMEYPGLIQSDGIHFGLTEAASEMVERYGMNADGSFKRQAAVTPEREGAMIYSVTLRYNIGDRVRVLVGKWQGMECTVIGTNALGADETTIKKVYRVADSDGNEGTVWYTYHELEPAALESEPETVSDDRPTVDESRLIETINELKALVAELVAENQLLYNKQQIMTLRIERLRVSRDTWSGMYVQVVKEKQESEAKYE